MRTVVLSLLFVISPVGHPAPPTAARSAATAPVTRAATAETSCPPSILAQENKWLKESKAAADKTVQELRAELSRLNTELISIRQASANVLQIQGERDSLQENVIALERELEASKRAKLASEEDHRQTWFLIGAGVLLAGIVIGFVLPQVSWRRRGSWDSF